VNEGAEIYQTKGAKLKKLEVCWLIEG